jgi:hypothetical protein
MARQPKDDVKPINRAQLHSVLARLKHIHTSLETVAKELKSDETLYISYLPSLFRGLERLEAVEPQLRRSLAMHRAGSPLMPIDPIKVEIEGSPAEFVIEDDEEPINQPVGRKKKTAAPAPKSANKTTAKRKTGT